ncbi:hypothetical protein Rt10032_c28g6843 [Rhodotorula toruloides]|uniref:Uncharacterized protein n=1 Tax=Rhodotorula toruloides TaxID=5286 RepID=A0A511KSE7_RHOTO|nr:hypothetical protein Rt10032_c28g6843 [Rhodotorula toruloides]
MTAVPPSPTRFSHSSRSSTSHNGSASDHSDGEIYSPSLHSDHEPEHPSLVTQGYSSSDDWSASDAEQDDFDLVASRDLCGSVSGASSEDEMGEGKMRLSFPDPMASEHEHDHDEDSQSARSDEDLRSNEHDGRAQDLATSLVGGDYSLLLDVSPASPVSAASTPASSSVPPLSSPAPPPSTEPSSTSAALHAWLRMSSDEKTDQAAQASLPVNKREGEKSMVIESMGSSAATVVPAAGEVGMRRVVGGEEQRAGVGEERKEEALATPTSTDASLKSPMPQTKSANIHACSSARPSRDNTLHETARTLATIFALCIGLWVTGSWLSAGKGLTAPSNVAISTTTSTNQVIRVASSAIVPALTSIVEAVTALSATSAAHRTGLVDASSASLASVPTGTKSWSSFLGLESAPVRSALPAAPELARLEPGVDSEGEASEACESSSTEGEEAEAHNGDEAVQDDEADSSSPFLLDAPEEAFKHFFSSAHMKELHEWFVATGQRSSRRFQQDAQDVLAHLAKMRAPVAQEQQSPGRHSSQHGFRSHFYSLRLPSFDYPFGVNRVRSRFADLSAISTSHADQVLRRAARSLDHLSSTTSHTLLPVVDRLKAGSRFSESKIKRAAWTAQVLERRVKWFAQGGSEEEYPKLCGCPFA